MEKHMTTSHPTSNNHLALLQAIAHRAMIERGLLPDFSAEVFAELSRLQAPYVKNDTPVDTEHQIRDMRELLWASIDNDDSFDLDQLTFAEAMPSGNVKILVAIADVDEVIKNDSAIDQHARHNTTSVYTAAEIFPMLPERISTDITSLNSSIGLISRLSHPLSLTIISSCTMMM
jgi:exoribonuclease-2